MSFQLVQQQFVSQKYFKPRPSIVLLLIFCFLTGVLSHLVIYFHQLNEGIRVVHSLFMGLCYDLMIASLITFFAIIFIFFLRSKFERLIIILFIFFGDIPNSSPVIFGILFFKVLIIGED